VATGGQSNPVHHAVTRRSKYVYFFSDKHHGGGAKGGSQWSPDLSRNEEFSIFDAADWHELSGRRGWLYGILRADAKHLRYLGTWGQQVAEFRRARKGERWHGYPLYPVNSTLAPPNRRGDKAKPSKEVFQKMERAALITVKERQRLLKGDYI